MLRGRPGSLPVLAALLAVVTIVLSGTTVGGLRGMPAGTGPDPAAVFAPSSATVAVAPGYAPAAGVVDVGPVGASTALTVDVGLASRDPGGLAAFVNATAVRGLPGYQEFLSPSAADARYGALPAAVAAAEAYFQGFGLTVSAHPDGLILSVAGPGPAVGRAFGTTFDLYRNASGSTFVDHATVADLPAVAPWTGVFGLSTVAAFRPTATPAAPAASPAASCPASLSGLSPCQVATAYDFPWVTGGANGSGERIAVVDAYSSNESQSDLEADFADFNAEEDLAAGSLDFLYPVPTTVNLNGSGVNPGWSYEDALDVEWAHASAPGATVEMVFSPNSGSGLYFAVDWIVAEGAANVLSMSWGEPEVGVFNAATTPCSSACNASSDGSFAILNPVLELAAAEGISTFAASGDCGAADGTSGVAVNYPASDPFVTGVGATDLALTASDAYSSESGWSGNSSGGSAPGCANQGGSGGGYSVLPRPWWQTGNGTVATRGRGVPDVSIVGGASSPVVTYVRRSAVALSGTSVGTPIWAGIAATADEVHGSALGWLDPSLYAVLRGPEYASAFHDVTSGWNGYYAHAGWDPVTGIGSPVVGALVAALARGSVTASSLQTFVYASPRFGTAPLTVHFAVATHGGSGSYAVQGVDFGDGNASPVVAGVVSHTYPSAGVYSVQAYAIDSASNTSASPPVVVVVGGGTALTVRLNASSTAPSAAANVTFTANVTGASGSLLYNFSFGDGTTATNLTGPTVTHAYPVAGGFCAEVVVRTTGSRPDGGASPRLAVAVGGASAPSCGNPASPLTVVPNGSAGVRDAPAEFPSLFSSSGGSSAPDGLAPQVDYVGLTPADPYLAACECAIFRTPGTYTVEEFENDSVDQQATASTTVTVAPALNATFTASALNGTVPLQVTFSATVSGGYDASAAATRWSFGNGAGETGATAEATYATAGEYVAIASLSDGGHGNASEAFVIDAEAAGTTSPGLSGTVTPAVNLSSGETVRWAATLVGSVAASAHDVIAWNLGNAGSAFGPSASETYFAPVDLLTNDELVASATLETARLASVVRVPITLPGFFATESGGFVPAADALELTEEVYPASGVVPLNVTANATATGPGGAEPTWQFGDGGSGTGTLVTHVYYGAGDFTVRAQAYDGFDDLAVRVDTVVANAALALSGCAPAVRSGSAPFGIELDPVASGGAGPPYTYLWALPNGSTSAATSVNLTFASSGTYAVSLLVTDPSGGSRSCVWSIDVVAVPEVSATEVVLLGAAAGVALAGVFLWATRPRRPA